MTRITSSQLQDQPYKSSVPFFGSQFDNSTVFNTKLQPEYSHANISANKQAYKQEDSAKKEERYYCGELENDQDSLILEVNLLERYSPLRVNKCIFQTCSVIYLKLSIAHNSRGTSYVLNASTENQGEFTDATSVKSYNKASSKDLQTHPQPPRRPSESDSTLSLNKRPNKPLRPKQSNSSFESNPEKRSFTNIGKKVFKEDFEDITEKPEAKPSNNNDDKSPYKHTKTLFSASLESKETPSKSKNIQQIPKLLVQSQLKASAVNIINSNEPLSDTASEFDFNEFKKDQESVCSKSVERPSESFGNNFAPKRELQQNTQFQNEEASHKENYVRKQIPAEVTNNQNNQAIRQKESVTFFRKSSGHRLP